MENWTDVIQAIKQKRGKRWRQSRIARAIGVAPSTITDLKNGKIKEPSGRIVIGLARLLGISSETLYASVRGKLPVELEPGEEREVPSIASLEKKVEELGTELAMSRRAHTRLQQTIGRIAHEIEAAHSDVPSGVASDNGTHHAASDEAAPGHSQILIVEDDRPCADILVKLLKVHGYASHIAGSGQEALAWLRSQRCDVVLLDIMMPEMDGYEVCAQMRSDAQLQSIPVIMVTAKTQPDDVVRGLRAGAADYVTKPFHNRELLARIEAVLRTHRQVA